ncbi:MAG: LysR family transcriptional regulator [Eubacteriales bacterium]|nr:LysR family transcriptional regulator [Eubacteriales bacterium]
MTLQQMRYVLYTARYGSISAAAQELFVSQPTVSGEIRKLEQEMDIQIFERSKSGIIVTDEGKEFIHSIRSIIEQADYVDSRYKTKEHRRQNFSVAGHHSAFISEAFLRLVKRHQEDSYRFQVLEVRTKEILDLVSNGQCDMGVILKDRKNRILDNELKGRSLEREVLAVLQPHVYLNRDHPLAGRESLRPEELLAYPFMYYYQGEDSWEYYSEEILGGIQNKKILVLTDRRTEISLSLRTNAYTIGSGIMDQNLPLSDTVSVPLETREEIELLWIKRADKKRTELMEEYLGYLREELEP